MDCKQTFTDNNKTIIEERDHRIDSVKYWLIVLVIAGHVFMRPELSESPIRTAIWKWIYLFHMPLFIFISGYFSRKKKDLGSSLWTIAEPLIIFQTITFIARCFFENSFSIVNLLSPWYVLWYVLSLIFWRLILQMIPDSILKRKKLVLVTALCISLLAGFLPIGFFLSIQRTLSLMPFFLLGYYMKGKNLFLPKKYRPLSIVFLLLCFCIPFFFSHYIGSVTHAEPYRNFYGPFRRLLVFAISIPMSVAFLNICVNRPYYARQGRMTMQYYIYHGLIIPPLMFISVRLGLPLSLGTAILYTVGITIAIEIALRFDFFRKLTNPSKFFIKNKAKK